MQQKPQEGPCEGGKGAAPGGGTSVKQAGHWEKEEGEPWEAGGPELAVEAAEALCRGLSLEAAAQEAELRGGEPRSWRLAQAEPRGRCTGKLQGPMDSRGGRVPLGPLAMSEMCDCHHSGEGRMTLTCSE